MIELKLTTADVDEIYYALELKAVSVESGEYDSIPQEVSAPGSTTFKWAKHLRQIMAKMGKR